VSVRPSVRQSVLPWLVAAVALAVAAVAVVRARTGAGSERIAWQYVSVGDSIVLNENGPALALAPDGSALLIRDNAQNGFLWLKRRGDLNATRIPGTERSQNPAFSPDGQWVIFTADGQLKKGRLAGGATVTLVDSVAVGYGGGAWLDDETLVYISQTLSELRRIPAAGGTSTVILRDTSGGGLGFPVPLPRGRGVLLQNCSSGCATMGIWVLDLKTGQQKLLIPDGARAWLLPDGRLFYVRRDGVGLVSGFDLDKLELTGGAVPVLERVRVFGGTPQLAWSGDGTLLYQVGSANQGDVQVVRVARDGARSVVDTAWSGAFNAYVVSPDGRRLAVGAGSRSGGLNIWIKQLDRGTFTRLTFGGSDRRPAWSPDGRLVAFVRDSAGSGMAMVKPADGSGPDRRIARLDRSIQEVLWSRDGQRLLVRTDNGSTGAGDILAVRVTGDSAPVDVAAGPFTEFMPALSPDGRWLAYGSNESGANEIYVRPFPDAGSARFQISNGGGVEPQWSRDGRELFFIDFGGRMQAAQVRTSAGGLAVDQVRPLFSTVGLLRPGFHPSYEVMPDGRFLFGRTQQGDAVPGQTLVQVSNWFGDIRARIRP